jgi:hypothetical protein
MFHPKLPTYFILFKSKYFQTQNGHQKKEKYIEIPDLKALTGALTMFFSVFKKLFNFDRSSAAASSANSA